MDNKVGNIALDVTEIQGTKRGQKVINGLMSSKGKLYHTARGRVAIQITPDIYDRIKSQLKITLAEGYDGTKLVVLADEAPQVPAPATAVAA